ncbi:MAG: TRAP transporter small permease [Spirochaetales bacterium]|jgi:C4-dicarboxylate transporter DctQ subunit|nr:TRAP transporter small permease [Spirochaetales bacterium]
MSKQNKKTKSGISVSLKKIWGFFTKAVDRLEVVIISSSTALLAVLLIANVAARTFYRSLYFAEEVSQFLIMLITFIGTSYAARKARQIRMGAIMEAFPTKLEKVFVMIISIISALVMMILAYHARKYMLVTKSRGQTTPSLNAPYWYFLIVAPVGFFMAGFQYIRTFIKNIIEKDVWLSPEQQSEYEEEGVMMAEALKDMESVDIKLKESK